MSTFVGNGTAGAFDSAVGWEAMLNRPRGVAVDGAGRVFFTDFAACTLRVATGCAGTSATPTPTATRSPGASATGSPSRTPTRTPTTAEAVSSCTMTTFAGSTAGTSGWGDGVGTGALFAGPFGLTTGANGTMLLIGEINGNRVRAVNATSGVVTTVAGFTAGNGGFVNAVGTAAQLSQPTGLSFDTGGNLYVADRSNHRVRVIGGPLGTTPTVGTFVGGGTAACFSGTSAALNNNLNTPSGVSVTPSFVFVASTGCNAVVRVSFTGASVLAGGGTAFLFAGSPWGGAGFSDGVGTNAIFNSPRGVTWDPATGNLYVSEDNGGRVRLVTSAGFVSTLAGSTFSGATTGFADGVGTAAIFASPNHAFVLASFNGSASLLVGDYNNSASSYRGQLCVECFRILLHVPPPLRLRVRSARLTAAQEGAVARAPRRSPPTHALPPSASPQTAFAPSPHKASSRPLQGASPACGTAPPPGRA